MIQRSARTVLALLYYRHGPAEAVIQTNENGGDSMSAYLDRVIENVKKKYAHEPEFVQTVEEVLPPWSR